MSKQRKRRQHRQSARPVRPATSFTPVPVRPRHDGWTPQRQLTFVQALAACACIEEACAAVGMSPRSFYDLRSRADAASFRAAVEAALDLGVHRVADAMIGRAVHGEVTPIFYKGEQVGERRRYDNRLGTFILRTRAPERYGKWRDRVEAYRDDPDGAAGVFAQAVRNLAQDAVADAADEPRPERPPFLTARLVRGDARPAYRPPVMDDDVVETHARRLEAMAAALAIDPDRDGDVSRGS